MNHNEIVAAALAYSNRSDTDTAANMDNFLRITESRINSSIHVQKQSKRAVIQTSANQEYYGLPDDFAGLRDIEVKEETSSRVRDTLQYRNPEQFNQAASSGSTAPIYTIIADQIQTWPTFESCVLEIVYYAKLPPLGSVNPENWLSRSNPDAYIFGLLVEISSFAKDVAASQLWEGRFQASLATIASADDKERWSGSALQVTLG